MSSLPAKALDYVGSSKNFVGLALFALGLGLFVAGATGAFGLAVAGIMYVVGAVVTPRKHVDLALSPDYKVDVSQLRHDLAKLERRVDAVSSRLPSDASAQVTRIMGALSTILSRPERLSSGSEDLFVVSATIRDYLPTSLEAYLNVPPSYALPSRMGSKRSAREELSEQLQILEGRIGEVAELMYQGDVAALENQGRFLRERFHRSSLDLTA